MGSLTLWSDPFSTDFDTIVRRVFAPSVRRTAGFVPAAEITRDGDDALVRIELPGLDVTKDVTVEVEDDRLVVRGERRDERSEERDGRSLREVHYGSFRRSFALPTHVDADGVTASYDAGVLTVRVAGVHAASGARRIPVQTAQPVEVTEQPAEQPAPAEGDAQEA
jgi:HSP20 family protein